VQPLDRALRRSGPGCCSWPLPVGPGHPGLLRGRWGGLDCLTSDRAQEAGWAVITGSREGEKPRRFDEKRINIFARALGPRRWSRSQAKAIRGHRRRPPGGPACTAARARGAGGGQA
jgi:hypothetical protein